MFRVSNNENWHIVTLFIVYLFIYSIGTVEDIFNVQGLKQINTVLFSYLHCDDI
jgi:hypothetical protein